MTNKLKGRAAARSMAADDCSQSAENYPELLTQKEVCDLLRISKSTLGRLIRSEESFPQPRKFSIGRLIRFSAIEVRQYVEAMQRAVYEDHAFDPNAGGTSHD
ncbi:MAG: helix-turn-helix domain-containing protein [Paracoccaceae bacterium]|nr:helix-turn-helix domain-containing protein [Paracoccaceae bacterium]